MVLSLRLYLLILMLGVLALSAAACAETAPTDGLEDTRWILESYGERGNLQPIIEGTEITVVFNSAESQVRGSAGCNSYFGDYEISNNKLSIPVIANTEMYCLEPEGVMDQEYQYLKVLRAAESYQIQDNKLQINCGGQILLYTVE